VGDSLCGGPTNNVPDAVDITERSTLRIDRLSAVHTAVSCQSCTLEARPNHVHASLAPPWRCCDVYDVRRYTAVLVQ
jgi:hypothetical protein